MKSNFSLNINQIKNFMRKTITILFILMTTFYMGYSQNNNIAKMKAKNQSIYDASTSVIPKRKCATMEHLEMQKQQDPTLDQKMLLENQKILDYIATHNNVKTAYTLPVIVHIVQKSTATQVTNQQVIDQIAQTNSDWAGTNGRSMESFSSSLRANSQITLCLATKDPSGVTLTNPGIHRVTTTVTNFTYDDKVKSAATGGCAAWDVTKYFNIWVCDMSAAGLCGYAQFPTSGINATYGVVIDVSCFGLNGTAQSPYNGGGTLSHEGGHCFNLYHIWGDDSGGSNPNVCASGTCCTGSDGYGDTPNQSVCTYGVHSGTLTDACTTTAPGIMYMNFMDYSDDADLANMTPNQCAAMQATVANYLTSLNTNSGVLCGTSTNPVAAFTGTPTQVNQGGTVTYTSTSAGTITSYSWSFPGGTPSSSTSAGPVTVTYNTVGVYDASLTVGTPNNTLTRTAYITVTAPGTTICGDWSTIQATAFTTQYRGLSSICIVDANTVWAPAYDGSGGGATIQEFTRTTNGGTSWTKGSITGNTTYALTNIAAVSATNAWAALYNPSSGLGKVMVTTNGGTSWTQQTSAVFSVANYSWADFIHFFDANNGVVVGDPDASGNWEIYTTSNAGTTWTRVAAANVPVAGSSEYGWTGCFHAVGNTIWFGTNAGNIYKSTNKGATWTSTSTGAASINEIKFIDANNGIAINKVYDQTSGDLTTFDCYKTTNGGSTWTAFTPSGMFTGEITPVPGTTSTWYSVGGVWPYVASTYGSSYSTNNGATWTAIDAVQYTAVSFLNSNTGWAGGFNTSVSAEGIFKWTPCTSVIPENVSNSENILLYPNPAGNEINVLLPYPDGVKVNISIMDIYGKLCKKSVISTTLDNASKIELNDLSNGIYFIKGESSEGKFVRKISVIK